MWQEEGEVFRSIGFASRFLTDCQKRTRTTIGVMGTRTLQALRLWKKSQSVN